MKVMPVGRKMLLDKQFVELLKISEDSTTLQAGSCVYQIVYDVCKLLIATKISLWMYLTVSSTFINIVSLIPHFAVFYMLHNTSFHTDSTAAESCLRCLIKKQGLIVPKP